LVLALVAPVLALGATPAQSADVANGQRNFAARCALCHSATRNGPNKVGPNLFGVMGRRAATYPGYSYSAGMRKAAITWNDATMRAYLANPARAVPGGKMAFAGITDAAVLTDVIAYLKTLR
jgi:cytochrome c